MRHERTKTTDLVYDLLMVVLIQLLRHDKLAFGRIQASGEQRYAVRELFQMRLGIMEEYARRSTSFVYWRNRGCMLA